MSTQTYVRFENIPFSTKIFLNLLVRAFFFKNTAFLVKTLSLSKQKCESCVGDFSVLFTICVS